LPVGRLLRRPGAWTAPAAADALPFQCLEPTPAFRNDDFR